MSNLISSSEQHWYDVPFQSNPLLSKTSYLVSFLRLPGHPIIGFTFPEGSVDGRSLHVRILPDKVTFI
jgi:hypothetical protein